ncbi:DeAcetylase [Cyanidiococcus yangmingshanensis]|uniref:DeAcetylase n=1 Tax=Cyanidiococcus yangmingshanensis TaxID=2690220 RepID=A0A7J7IKF6_9RHOD|nr:DeAcetylase [Cyanidiococcus yangmingshanensis]
MWVTSLVQWLRGRRARVRQQPLTTLEDLAARLVQRDPLWKVMVILGAGVSTAAGIPDFRSPETGLYARLEAAGRSDVSRVFDIDYFREHPQAFYLLAHELLRETGGRLEPTLAHWFVRCLADHGLLLRCYTQNVDGLERIAGVPESLLVEAHGTVQHAHCSASGCGATYDAQRLLQQVVSGEAVSNPPRCPRCRVGYVKPKVVFFGEQLPWRFFRCLTTDVWRTDLCLILGTSLTVAPVRWIPDRLSRRTPRVLLNRTISGSIGRWPLDSWIESDVQKAVERLVEICGWREEINALAGVKREARNAVSL